MKRLHDHVATKNKKSCHDDDITTTNAIKKIELSSSGQTEVNLPYLTADASGPKHL